MPAIAAGIDPTASSHTSRRDPRLSGPEPTSQIDQIAREIDEQRDERGHVQEDVEGQARLLPAECFGNQHEVPGGGDRDELGHALDQAQDHRFEE